MSASIFSRYGDVKIPGKAADTMRSTLQSLRQSRTARVLLPVGCVVAVGSMLWAGHQWAISEVVRRAAAANVQVQRADVSIGLGTASLRNFTWSAGPLAATIESADVEVVLSALPSKLEVERIAVAGVKVVQRARPSRGVEEPPGAGAEPGTLVTRLLARLGGTPPEVVVERVEISASLDSERTVGVAIDHGVGRVDGAEWRFTGRASLALPSIEGVQVGTDTTVEASMKLHEDVWTLDSAKLRFGEPAKLVRDDLTIRVAAVGVTGRGDALLSEVVVQGAPHVAGPVKVGRIEAGPLSAIAARSRERLEFVRVSGADVTLHSEVESGASATKRSRGWNDRVAAMLSKAFARADEVLAQGAKLGETRLEVADSELRVPRFDSTFSVRSASLTHAVDGPEARASFAWSAEDVEYGVFDVAYAAAEQQVKVVAHDVDLESFGSLVGRELGGVLNADISVTRVTDDDGVSYPVGGTVAVKKLHVSSTVLASEPVEVAPIALTFAAEYAPQRRTSRSAGVFTSSQAHLQVGKVELDVRPAIFGLRSLPDALPERAELEFDLKSTPVQRILDAVPVAVLGPLNGAKLEGTLALKGRIDLPLHAPQRLKWEIEPELAGFRIVSLPNDVDVRRLMTSATYTLADNKIGHERTIFVPAPRSPNNPLATDASSGWKGASGGCGSYVYVPLDQITPHLASGVLSTEDRGFLWHDGFNFNALRESLAANIAEGRIVRGGSTITMQLIKNVFLDRSRTVARKLREVFLVWLTESVVDVPKSRLLEVYFNVIEYGPRVMGIWHAATYFFAKRPRDLTVGEVAWFITTLTGPKIYHHQFVKGEISERVWERMRARIDMLYQNDYITELDLVRAKARPPVFRPASSPCAPGLSPHVPATPEEDVLATALLRLRRSGAERSEVMKRLDDPTWQVRTLAAPRPPRPQIEWSALPLARDKYSWWRMR